MIDKENCYLLGKIRKTTGFTGEVIIATDFDLPDETCDFVFIHLEIDGALIPFFIKELDVINSRSIRLSFLDVPDQEKAKKLVDLAVYIEKSQLSKETENSLLSGIEGFVVTDIQLGRIGIVETLLQNPGQDLLVVKDGEREVLIPVAEELIISIDQKKKSIKVNLPEGLVDLNG